MSDGMCYRPFEISMLIYYHFFFKGFFPSNISFPTCVKKEEEEKKKKGKNIPYFHEPLRSAC